MDLNLNSITADLYRWFYYKDHDEMPDNFCPYFWKVVIMYTFILPFVIFSIPSFIITWVQKDSYNAKGIKEYLGISFFIYLILCTLFGLSGIFWNNLNSTLGIISFACWSVVIVVSTLELIFYIKKRYPSSTKLNKSRNPNLIIAFIKAKYNKLCPRIKWLKRE